MSGDQIISVATDLLCALYAAPQHGPAVAAALPDPKAMPDRTTSGTYGLMIEFGIREGRFDYALFDARMRNVPILERIHSEAGFMMAQQTHESDPSMMIAWAVMIEESGRSRRLATELEAIAKSAKEGHRGPNELVALIIERARGYLEGTTGALEPITTGVERAIERTMQWQAGHVSDYLLTGFPSIDEAIGGLQIGHMSVMAGMTSGYKTAALVELMKRVANRFKGAERLQNIVVFSAEMSHERLVHRLASNVSGIPQVNVRPIKNGFYPRENDLNRYREALRRVGEMPIMVNEQPDPTYEQMYAQCMQAQAVAPISFVAFDYLEKMGGVSEASEELRVSRIAQDLSRLAKRLSVPIVTLSQYSRKSPPDGSRTPSNDWLRYSGKIEQEAAAIIHWWYPKYFVDRRQDPGKVAMYDPSSPNDMYAFCGKNRDGSIRDAKLEIVEEVGRFIDPMDERLGDASGERRVQIPTTFSDSPEVPF